MPFLEACEHPAIVIFGLATLAFADSIFLVGYLFSGTLLLAAAYASMTRCQLPIEGVWAGALIGALAGDSTMYVLGRSLSSRWRARIESWLGNRGVRAKAVVQKYGILAVVGGRFTWLTRKIVPFASGTLELPTSRFLIGDAIGCVAWVTFWCIVLAGAKKLI
jgi:membrane protein DedA with SNARE-associated domain